MSTSFKVLMITIIAIASGFVFSGLMDEKGKMQAELALLNKMREEQGLKDQFKGRIKDFALARMDQVKSKLSPLRRDLLAANIAEVASRVFEREDHAQAFVSVLAIESGFNRSAQSPTGPRGLGQVARAAYAEGLKRCTDLAFSDDDAWDVEVNLLSSSCYFKTILDGLAEGNVFVAIIAYNAGPNSEDVKTFKKTGRIEGSEPLRYLAKFVHLTNPALAIEN